MNTRSQQRIHRKRRIRAKLSGSADIPRLSVFRSHRALSVQVINDVKGETLLSATVHGTTKKDARVLGEEIGKKTTGDGLIAITNWHLLVEDEEFDEEISPLGHRIAGNLNRFPAVFRCIDKLVKAIYR